MSYPGGHGGLVATALLTHALVGFTLGLVVAGRPWSGLFGGLLADVDFLFPAAAEWPLVHRGLTHTLVAAVAVTALVLAISRRRDAAAALGAGYASHLLVDATTATGIPALYPLSPAVYTLPGNGHSVPATVAIWTACFLALGLRRWQTDDPVVVAWWPRLSGRLR